MFSSNVLQVAPSAAGLFYANQFANMGVHRAPTMLLSNEVGNDAGVAMDTSSLCETVNDSLTCHHCAFQCRSATEMTQHRWEEHPLLMKKKKHLMTSSGAGRKRQMSENFDRKISEDVNEEPRMKRATSTDSKDSNDSSSDERMSPHEFNVLNKVKSSSLGDIPSLGQNIGTDKTHQPNGIHALGTGMEGIAAAPLVALYGQHMMNCITTSLLEPSKATKTNSPPVTLAPKHSPAASVSNYPSAPAWPLGNPPNPTLHSTYISGDKLSQGFVATPTSASISSGYNFSHFPCVVPYPVSSLISYDQLSNQRPLSAHVTGVPHTGAVEPPRSEVGKVTGHISCSFTPPNGLTSPAQSSSPNLGTQYPNKLSALSNVASRILTNDMSRSPHVIAALVPPSASTRPRVAHHQMGESREPKERSSPISYANTTAQYLDAKMKQHHISSPASAMHVESAIRGVTSRSKAVDKNEFEAMRSGRVATTKQTRPMEVNNQQHPASVSRSTDDRMKSLEEALRNSDCCEGNMHISVMPMQCPDGKWKMVRAKRIAGAWIIQMPDKDTTSVVLPREAPKAPTIGQNGGTQRSFARQYMPGDACKRLLTDGSTNASKHYNRVQGHENPLVPSGAIMSLLLKS
uniref:ZF(C2H2)-52 zinc finger protein n=1 Tax=Phallusia mammillata TaxID=59560 RepID=A0A6F9DPD1_9ASCI|nr:ZF(C2H2)-52 zinc finger protein [Phallusia mammillata]